MKDKRTYKYEKEHGEDMTHENESTLDFSAMTDQYRADLKKYQDKEGEFNELANDLVMEILGHAISSKEEKRRFKQITKIFRTDQGHERRCYYGRSQSKSFAVLLMKF